MREESLSIHQRLRKIRESLGYSQQELADKGGVSRVTQGKYERGDRKPDAAYLTAIAHLAGVDVQYIICGVRSANLDEITKESDEDQAARLDRITGKIMRIAEGCARRPDPLKLGPLRDLALSAHLSDDQIKTIFGLLEQASKPDFWLDSAGAVEGGVTQVIGQAEQVAGHTIHNHGKERKNE